MSAPAELSFDEILKYMLAHNGKVTNYDLVKHFKVFLMNPNTRDEARSTFKKHVNTLAIIKYQNNEKWLVLKKKYMPPNLKENEAKSDNKVNEMVTDVPLEDEKPPSRPPPPLLNQDLNVLGTILPAVQDVTDHSLTEISDLKTQSEESLTDIPPKIVPRRKSEKAMAEKSPSTSNLTPRMSIPNESTDMNETPTLTSSRSESMLADSEQTISVKERKQMFNRMASESDVLKSNKLKNLSNLNDDDSPEHKEDAIDSKQKQWILSAARGDYHVLAKMCKENPKLVKTKDPFTTAMHWACKRGDLNVVKLLAGTHRDCLNERSNGGYTPLHIAQQFQKEEVYRLLIQVYNADTLIRDWSGRKATQYLFPIDTYLSPGSHRKKESFLRIGSLNVRVKKTTEVFSNFLGVGTTRSSAYVPKSARDRDLNRKSDSSDQLKAWGSADNIPKEDKMPPPMTSKVRRRGASGRKGVASHSRSTPSTPDQPRAKIGVGESESDSDTAAGFHSAWRQQRASQS